MKDAPPIRYAWSGAVSLAYQVFGDGPVDLVYLQGYCSHLDVAWDSPYLARFLRGLGGRARVIATDRRGWGLSARRLVRSKGRLDGKPSDPGHRAGSPRSFEAWTSRDRTTTAAARPPLPVHGGDLEIEGRDAFLDAGAFVTDLASFGAFVGAPPAAGGAG